MSYSQPWQPTRRQPAKAAPATPAEPADPISAPPTDPAGPRPGERAAGRRGGATNRGRRRQRTADDLLVPPGTPLTRQPVAALGDDGWRVTAETVDRLLGHDRTLLQAALAQRSEERLRAAVPLARTLLADVTTILADVQRRSARPGATAAATSWAPPPSGALRIARDFPWPELLQRYGRTNDAGCLAAARSVQQELRDLDPDELGTAHTLLEHDLGRLRRALRRADRTDRPLSAARLRALLTAVLRVVETVSIGLLAAAVTAVGQGSGVSAAVFTAGIGLAVSTSCEQAVRLVRAHVDPPSPAQRFAAAHEELDLAVGDLRQLLTDGGEPGLVADTRTAALALAHHARRLAGTVTWPRSAAYVAAVDALVPVLTADPADPAALHAAAEAVATIRLPSGRRA